MLSGMKWPILLVAGVLTACQAAVISSSENGVTVQHTGSALALAASVANGHCREFGKHAVLIRVDDIVHTAQFRCAEGLSDSNDQPDAD